MREEEGWLTGLIIGAAIEVHRELGPGLLESVYEECLAYELSAQGLSVRRQVPLPLIYKQKQLDAGYRIDLLVEDRVIVEVKAVEAIAAVHKAQLMTYLKLSGLRVGLLLNFHVSRMREGIVRWIL